MQKFAVIKRLFDRTDHISVEIIEANSSESAWDYCESLTMCGGDVWLMELNAFKRFAEVITNVNRKLSKMRKQQPSKRHNR